MSLASREDTRGTTVRTFLRGIGNIGLIGLVGLVGLVGAKNLLASEKVAALVEAELAKDGIGGISLGIVQGSELVYEAAFGYADMEKKIEAMACYCEEMRPRPHPRSEESLRAVAQRWGSVVGVGAAEAFQLVREIW